MRPKRGGEKSDRVPVAERDFSLVWECPGVKFGKLGRDGVKKKLWMLDHERRTPLVRESRETTSGKTRKFLPAA